MNFDYAIHSDFLIHWTGKDIDQPNDAKWYGSDKSKTNKKVSELYIKRLHDILKYGLWMTLEEKSAEILHFGNISVSIPDNPQTCFTELKLSESRKHARQYGRMGIGVKRPFVFNRFGRPLIYYGFHTEITNDKFLKTCATKLENENKKLLNFFKPMNRSSVLNYDFYSESEWRIIYFDELLSKGLVVDPRDTKNIEEHEYFCSLTKEEQDMI